MIFVSRDRDNMNVMKGWMSSVLVMILVTLVLAEEVVHDAVDKTVDRHTRGAVEKDSCKYDKSNWSECDPNTHMKNRTLALKKGNPATCETTKTISRKCKKACRYEKGVWSPCNAQGEMIRTDLIKESNSDSSCNKSKTVTKECKNKNRKAQGQRRGRQ